jgi:hypothetical protein
MRGKGIIGLGLAALGALSILAGCTRPLPEEGSAAAELYRQRCGTTCHRPFQPSSMKYPLWNMVLPRMDQRIHEAGQPPLNLDERMTIDSYLRRNGG